MVHLKACARNRKQKAVDYAMITFGIVCCMYTSFQTLKVCFYVTRCVDEVIKASLLCFFFFQNS